MSEEVLHKIKNRGYWHVVIRPMRFIKERIPTLRECTELVQQNQVRHGGWYFPHIEASGVQRRFDYIELASRVWGINEAWRFYQSGQFAYFRGLAEDWLEENLLLSQPISDIEPGTLLEILPALHLLSEVYEFTTRLAQAGIFDDVLFLKVNLVGTQDRQLFFWPGQMRFLSTTYVCRVPELPREATFKVTEFVAQSREYSLRHFLWVMEHFGFDASEDLFRRDQEKFFQGRY